MIDQETSETVEDSVVDDQSWPVLTGPFANDLDNTTENIFNKGCSNMSLKINVEIIQILFDNWLN